MAIVIITLDREAENDYRVKYLTNNNLGHVNLFSLLFIFRDYSARDAPECGSPGATRGHRH